MFGKAHCWGDKMRGLGCRRTVPRQAILDVLSSTSKHLSAEDIYFSVHKAYPAIGLTTVYRTLELLGEMGIVHKFDFGDRRSRYELAESQNRGHHHHLICTGCGRVIDYDDFVAEELKLVKQVENALSKRHNFKIATHQIHFFGVCNKCNG